MVEENVTIAHNELAAQETKLVSVGQTVDLLENRVVTLESAGSQSELAFYTLWGSSDCGDDQLLVAGYVYGTYAGYHGPSNQVCLPESPQGGQATGSNYMDLMYPLQLGTNHG